MDSSISHLSENNKSVPLCSVSKALFGPVTIRQDSPALSIGLCLSLSNGLQQVGGRTSVDSGTVCIGEPDHERLFKPFESVKSRTWSKARLDY